MAREELDSNEEESLVHALEGLEAAQSTVVALQEFVRKNEEDEEAGDGEKVPEKKIWSKEKAEAQAKTEGFEREYAAGEKTNSAVVKGVKGVVASAHESKHQKREGQQKWKMFETHYQREKHITLEESLDEIERYSKYGEVPKDGYAPKKKEAGNVALRQKLEANFHKDKMKGRKPGVAPVGNPKRLAEETVGSGTGEGGQDDDKKKEDGVTDKIEEKKPENKAIKAFANNLKKGGNEGSKYFEQYQKRERKKYQPTYGMKNYY